jgi:DNA-binding GntR family transcriptional regulator
MGVGAKHAVELRRSQTLVSICQAEIERMILEGELERGARINELALAARLGTSRGPLREACRSLAQAGLLETHANRGFFVRKLAHRDVADLYDLRATRGTPPILHGSRRSTPNSMPSWSRRPAIAACWRSTTGS